MVFSFSSLPLGIQKDVSRINARDIKEIQLNQYHKYTEVTIQGKDENGKPFFRVLSYPRREDKND